LYLVCHRSGTNINGNTPLLKSIYHCVQQPVCDTPVVAMEDVFPIRIHCNKDFGIASARAVYPSTEERRGTTCDLRPATLHSNIFRHMAHQVGFTRVELVRASSGSGSAPPTAARGAASVFAPCSTLAFRAASAPSAAIRAASAFASSSALASAATRAASACSAAMRESCVQTVIEAPWVSKPLTVAGKLRARRLSHRNF
jgi:hypothetical protein